MKPEWEGFVHENHTLPLQFPKVFEGLGDFGEPYTIKLKEARSPRNVPIPLRAKVLEELKRMESLGVVSKVSEQTSWYAGLIVVLQRC